MFKRFIQENIAEALQDTPVIVLNGARQTGKSTLCHMLMKEQSQEMQYVTFDDVTSLSAAQFDPVGFIQGLQDYVVLDEIQRVPELFLTIKQFVDKERQKKRFILTGSADVMTLPKLSESLAGRIEIHNLWSLSQGEIEGKRSSFLERLIADKFQEHHNAIDRENIIQRIILGGYPEILSRSTAQRRYKWFESYVASILHKDIKELANIEGLIEVPNLLEVLASRVGTTVNLADISRLLSIPNTTLKRYYTLLQHVFLAVELPAWTPNFEGKFVKSPKIFMNDTGLLCYLRGDDEAGLLSEPSRLGAAMENFVVMEIYKQLTWSDTSMKPYHFRSHHGIEIDMVLETRRGDIYGIEVKSSASVKASDFKGLQYLSEKKPNHFKRGIVFYTGSQFVQFSDNLFAVPLPALWR